MAAKKTIILIQPKETDVDLVVNRPYLPLALLSISRSIHADYSVVIIDQRTDSDWENRLTGYAGQDVVCVGVSCLLGNQIKYCLQVSEIVKRHFECPLIWGGVHDPDLIREILDTTAVDGVVRGEGEQAFTELVRRLAQGMDTRDIPGYWSKENRGMPKQRPEFLDMDGFAPVPYHLIDVRKYARYRGGAYTISYESSRGCDSRCAFCACPQYSEKWRGRSAANVVADIRYLTRVLKMDSLFVVDDNFFGDIARAKDIFDRLIEEGIRVNLDIYGMRIDTVERLSDEDLGCMVRAGVRKVVIGVEAGSQRVLDFINKGITVRQVLEQNQRLARCGVYVQYNFITGYPTESLDEITQTVRLALRLVTENRRAMMNYFCIFVPLPGAGLYRFQKEHGLPVPRTLAEWSACDRLFVSGREGTAVSRKLNIISLFVDGKVDFYAKSRLLRFLTALYRPFARFRMRHLFFRWFIEEKIFMAVNRLKLKADI